MKYRPKFHLVFRSSARMFLPPGCSDKSLPRYSGQKDRVEIASSSHRKAHTCEGNKTMILRPSNQASRSYERVISLRCCFLVLMQA